MSPVRIYATKTSAGDWRVEVTQGTLSQDFSACSLVWDQDRTNGIKRAVKDWRRTRNYYRTHPPETTNV